MKRIIKKLFKESSIYSLQPTFEKLIGFVLLPIYTAYLSTAEYGMLQYIITIGAFLLMIISGGLQTSFWKFRSDDNQASNEEVALNILLTQLSIGVCVVILLYLVKDRVFDQNISTLVVIYVVGQVIYTMYRSILFVLRAAHKPVHYVVVAILYALILAGLNILFIVYFKMNYAGIIYGIVISNILFSFLLIMYSKEYSGKINLKLSAEMLKYGAPLILGNLAALVISMSDRLFLKAYSTESELGLYSIGYQFANLVMVFLITPFFLGWNPMRWEICKMENAKEIFSKIYKGLLFFLPVAALMIISIAIIVGKFLVSNSEYLSGFSITATIAFSHVFFALYYFNSMGMLFQNKTKLITATILTAAFVNMLLNYMFIPEYGMIGAALATLLSYFTMFALASYFCQKHYPFAKSWVLEASLVLFVVTISLISIFLYSNNYLSTYMLSLFIFCSGVILIIINIVTKQISVSDFAKVKSLFFDNN